MVAHVTIASASNFPRILGADQNISARVDRRGLSEGLMASTDMQGFNNRSVTTESRADTPPHFDSFDTTFLANPYPTYARFRANASLHHNGGGDGGGWYAFRHEDCVRILHDSDMIVEPLEAVYEPGGPYSAFEGELQRQMLFRDPPAHTRLRATVSRAFTPRSIELMTSRIQQITARLMEPLVRAGTFDFIQAVAIPLPLLVIADLLGVPDHDQNLLKQWSHAMVA
jgi:cytochrome P450